MSKFSNFQTIEQSSQKALKMISRFLEINTLFVAKNDRCTNEMVSVLNRNEVLVEDGSSLPFEKTLCNVAVKGGNKVLVIPNLLEHDDTKNLEVSKKLGGGSFIGIPIYYENGENYGTICGLDTKPIEYKEEHVELFQTIAELLSSVLEAERMYKEMHDLSVPIVPIAEGIAIVPIIGNVDTERVELILNRTLGESQRSSLSYLILDLSGVVKIDGTLSAKLVKIINSLKLLGVTAILTGIRPDLAIHAVDQQADFKNVIIQPSLQNALHYIGLQFIQQS